MSRARRSLALLLPVVVSATLAACGGGGGGGTQVAARVEDWGVPFVPSSPARAMTIGLRNLDDDGTSVTLQGYRPDGTPYTGPVFVDLDGWDEHHLSAPSALGGDTPAGGWIHVMTPSERVEVFFDLDDSPETETARASKIGDLLAPPPSTRVGLTTHLQTDTIQISNATGAATAITVTPFEEPQSDPDLPPDEHPSFVLGFAAFETKTFDPDGLSGVSGFVGSFRFEAATPFFVAADEDFLSLDVQSPVQTRLTKAPDQISSSVALRFGREVTGLGTNFFDFALVMRNDTDDAQTVTIESIHDADGGVILDVPRAILLDPNESRVEDSAGFLFGDLFGDVFTFSGIERFHVRLTTSPDVDTSFRQFDPAALAYAATYRTIPEGHVFDVSDVQGTFPAIFDVVEVINPTDTQIVVDVTALIPEPEDFDASPLLLTRLTLPPHTAQTYVVDGEFRNRDLETVPFLGLRLTSLAPFGLTSYRERRDGADLLVYLTPRLVANHEIAGDY